MIPEANQTTGATIISAANKIQGILSDPAESGTTGSPEVEKPQPQPEAQASEAETQEGAPAPESDTEPKSKRGKAKIGDRDIEFELFSDDISPEDFGKSLMMESDYRRKTMSHAEKVKAFEAKQNDFDSKLVELQDILLHEGANLESKEMLELKEADPDQYWQTFEKVRNKAEKFQKWKQERESELLQQHEAMKQAEMDRYPQVVPEWLDEKQKDADLADIYKMLESRGFSQEQIASTYNADILAICREAVEYRKLKARNLEEKRVRTAPKTVKASGVEKPAKANSAMAKLRKTGKVADAQKALESLLL